MACSVVFQWAATTYAIFVRKHHRFYVVLRREKAEHEKPSISTRQRTRLFEQANDLCLQRKQFLLISPSCRNVRLRVTEHETCNRL